MKAKLQTIALGVMSLVMSLGMLGASPVFAANPAYSGVQCNGAAAASPVCSAPTTDPITGSNGVIVKATNLIALAAGFAAVIIIIVSGFRFITANGDANQVSSARSGIIYAAVGIVVIVLAKTIITFVVSRV